VTIVARRIQASWGADTDAVLSAADAVRLKAAGYQGRPLVFLWRYGADVSLVERDAILSAGWILLLVEHVQRTGWQSRGRAGGELDGQRDVFHAQRLGAPPGKHLGIDLEGLGDQGVSVEDYVLGRCHVQRAAGFLPACYEGFDDGLTMQQRLDISGPEGVDVWWSDFGSRTPPPGIGFVCTQHPTVFVAGIEIDPDECHGVDLRGRPLVGMVDLDTYIEVTDPAIGSSVGGIPLPFPPGSMPPDQAA
jgi:hypothetical protein